MPSLIGGFTLQTKVPIDDRFVTSSSADRFDYSAGLMYDGLPIYTSASQEYFIIVSASQYGTADSASAFSKIVLTDPGNNDISNVGQLSIEGIGNVSASIAALELEGLSNLQNVTTQGPGTTNVITASNGIISPIFYALGGDGSAEGSKNFGRGRMILNPSEVRIASYDVTDGTPIFSGLALSGGIANDSNADILNFAPRITTMEHNYLSITKTSAFVDDVMHAAWFKFSSANGGHGTSFYLSGSISASKSISSSLLIAGEHAKSPKYIIFSSSTNASQLSYHTEGNQNFLAVTGSGVKIQNKTQFQTSSLGALMVKDGVLYVGVEDD